MESNGELLPLISKSGEYYLYNLLTVSDVLDIENSTCALLFEHPPFAVSIDHFVFHEERLKGLSIFRVPKESGSIFVTDEFVRRVEEANLNGFEFSKV